MANEVRDAVGRAEADPHVVGIVLTGAGKGFCAGADMKGLAAASGADGGGTSGAPDVVARVEEAPAPGDPSFGDDLRGTYTYFMSVPKPIVAAINGAVAGMGVPIVLGADLRFMNENAVITTSFAPARPRRRVRPVVAADPARRPVARPRPAVHGAQGEGRRGGPHRARQPGAAGRGRPAGGHRLHPRPRHRLVAGVDGGDEAAGLPRPQPDARPGPDRGRRADEGELQAPRLPGGREVLPRAPPARVPPLLARP